MIFRGLDTKDGIKKEINVEDSIITRIKILSDNTPTPLFLSPVFTDMQVNGYKGIDYSGDDLTEEKILSLIDTLSLTGTLRHVPTIITNSEERIIKNLTIISNTVEKYHIAKEAIPGVHIEGPFISSLDGPRGAHDPRFVRELDILEVKRWQKSAKGLVKIITIAPEKKGAVPFIKEATKIGITVSIGHAEPSDEEIDEAIDAGCKLSTHLGNGSSATLPRLKNHIWKQVAEDRLIAGIITDGFHLPESVIRTFYRTKGKERLILVSDVAPLGGLEPGLSKWGNIAVEICADGHLQLAGTSLLAGAGHLLDHDIVKFMKNSGASIKEAIETVTINPMKVLGLEINNFEVGQKADIMAFKIEGDKLKVEKAALGGYLVMSE